MNITVNIDYRTAWGERLVLVLAGGKRVDMSCSGSIWVAMFSVPKSAKKLEYTFEVVDSEGNTLRTEWGEGHSYAVATDAKSLVVEDCWADRPSNRAFYTSMFTDTVFSHEAVAAQPLAQGGVRLEVEAVTLRRDEALALAGSTAQMGEWDDSRLVAMEHVGGSVWSATLQSAETAAEYKFVVVNKATGAVVRWEEGQNRVMPYFGASEAAYIIRGMLLVPWHVHILRE